MSEAGAKYRTLFETTPDIVVMMDEDGLVVDANPSVEVILGYKPEDLRGKPLSRIMPERFRASHHTGFHRYLQTKERSLDWRSIQLPGLCADGREIPLSISFGEFEEDGRRYFTGILRDISAEKATADLLEFMSKVGPELASSSLDYRTTLTKLAELAVPFLADWSAVDIMSDDGRLERLAVAHADPAKVAIAREITTRYPASPDSRFGAPEVVRTGRAEMVSEIPDAFLGAAAKDEEHLELIQSLGLRSYLIAPIRAHGRVYGALSLVQAESGRRFRDSDVPLMEELGRRAGLAVHDAGLYRDALEANHMLEEQAAELEQQTEEAQALAEEMETQTEELVETADELRRKTEEAAAANAAKSAFLASMSHELRTPLNAIAGYVELLEMGLRGPVTDEQKADLERIRLSQRHLLALINDVLNFAKIEAGRLDYRLEIVALDKVLDECETMVRPQIQARRISYTHEECAEAVLVLADREKTHQIVINLLGNAIKFTPEGGSITAVCDQTGTVGRICVRDTGVGIESEKLETIFEPFVQIDRTLNQPGVGAGLGLAISLSLARGMGGDIEVVSELGVGSTFTLSLPRSDPA